MATPSGIGKKPAEYTSSSFQNVMKCNVDIRVNLYIPAMLPGGTTMFQRNFKEHDKGIDGVGLLPRMENFV